MLSLCIKYAYIDENCRVWAISCRIIFWNTKRNEKKIEKKNDSPLVEFQDKTCYELKDLEVRCQYFLQVQAVALYGGRRLVSRKASKVFNSTDYMIYGKIKFQPDLLPSATGISVEPNNWDNKRRSALSLKPIWGDDLADASDTMAISIYGEWLVTAERSRHV